MATKPAPTTAFEAKQLRELQTGKKQALTFKQLVRYYLAPLTALVIFVSMGLFLILPRVARIFTDLDLLSSVGTQTSEINTQIAQVKDLSTTITKINTDLGKIDTIAPEGTAQVVQFQTTIRTISDRNGLEWLEGSGEEQIVDTNETDTSTSSELGKVEIPSIFTLRGSLTNIRNFIKDVLEVDQMVVINEMALRRYNNSADTWDLTITLVKYQFQTPNEFNRLEAAYLNVPVSEAADQKVLDLVYTKTAGD